MYYRENGKRVREEYTRTPFQVYRAGNSTGGVGGLRDNAVPSSLGLPVWAWVTIALVLAGVILGGAYMWRKGRDRRRLRAFEDVAFTAW